MTSHDVNSTAEEMDQADQELRETITHIWPLQAKKMLDLLVPRSDELNAGKLTVGKIYAGLLILESWRNTKFGQLETDAPVSKIKSLYRLTNNPKFPKSNSPNLFKTPPPVKNYFYVMKNIDRIWCILLIHDYYKRNISLYREIYIP